MSNEPEWRDANPSTEDLPFKGRDVIICIAGGILLFILTIVGNALPFIRLAVGGFAFMSGLTMLLRRRQLVYKPGLLLTACGFLMLLAFPRFGVVTVIAGTVLTIAAIGLVVFGLFKAIKLAWDLGRFS